MVNTTVLQFTARLMSLSSILKNIYTFAHIVSQAQTDVVKFWDMRSFHNAVNWAKYCMKIEEQTRNSPHRHDLNNHIQLMTIFLMPVTLLELDIERLGNATTLLYKVLLGNLHLPDSLLQTITDLDGQEQMFRPVNLSDQRSESTDDMLYQVIGVDRSFCYASVVSATAQHVMGRLVKLRYVSLSCLNRFQNFLQRFIMKISEYKTGWTLLLHIFLTDVQNDPDHHIVETLKGDILNIIMKSATIYSGLWKCEPDLLCEVSSRDDRFLTFYTDHIFHWACQMVPKYGVTESGDLYEWRFLDTDVPDNTTLSFGEQDNTTLSFGDLCRHIQCLMCHDKKMKLEDKQTKGFSASSYCHVIKDVLNRCDMPKHHLLSQGSPNYGL